MSGKNDDHVIVNTEAAAAAGGRVGDRCDGRCATDDARCHKAPDDQ